jgi:hypothetical protein
MATFLLSSLRKSEELWKSEVPKLNSAIEAGHCSLDRATIGTWRIENVEAGIYTAQIYKEGFDTIQIEKFQFVGNGELEKGNFALKKPLDIRVESLQILNPKLIFDLTSFFNKQNGYFLFYISKRYLLD